jgi:hypothetical protein
MGSMKMPDEQRGLFSRLPDDSEYWHGLTDRIVEDAVPQVAAFGEGDPAWWSEIARFSTMLAAGAAAAVLASFFLVPDAEQVEMPAPGLDAYGLAPVDPIAVTLVSEATPPTMETLIAVRNAESDR